MAERKVLGLLAAGAGVVVVSPELTAPLEALRDEGKLEHVPRGLEKDDLAGAFLAVLATDDLAANLAAAREARRHGVLVNVVDNPAASDFVLPAVLRRGDLVVAVSTNGRSPAAARYLRDELAGLLTPEHLALFEVMADVRAELSGRGQKASGQLWRSAVDGELLALVGRGSLAEARSLLLARLARRGGADD